MKPTRFANLLMIGLALSAGAIGCRTSPQGVTRIPKLPEKSPSDLSPELPTITPGADTNIVGIPLGPGHLNWPKDTKKFAAYTVHFDFDSSVVKSSEKTKVAAVADYLKANTTEALEVDGHCDERGTEEYNRALGERRALALREELVGLGVAADRVDTLSYGEDKPVNPGHNEEAWAQNRRGEFILLLPPK